jgi:hypothetical protein
MLLPLLLAGCIKIDQTLTLAADGSGTFAMRYGMAEQTIAQLQAMRRMAEQNEGAGGLGMAQKMPFEFEPEQVRAAFEADKPSGVELVDVSAEVVDGWRFIDLTLSFDDIRALKRTEFFDNSQFAIEPIGGRRYRITQRGGNQASAGSLDGDALAQQIAPMLAGFRAAHTLVVPGEITDTNAPSVDGRAATWVFDLAQDPNPLQTLNETELMLIFDGEGVALPTVSP